MLASDHLNLILTSSLNWKSHFSIAKILTDEWFLAASKLKKVLLTHTLPLNVWYFIHLPIDDVHSFLFGDDFGEHFKT